jgi:penicillin-insensitive murein endopeptidase
MNHKRSLFNQLLVSSLLLGSFAFVACAPSAGTDPLKTKPTATSTPTAEKPSLYQEEGVEVVRGGVHSEKIDVAYDEVTKSMTLKGQLQLTPFDGGPLAVVDISLVGKATDADRISLKPLVDDKTPNGIKVAAKATCLDEAGGCSASFIDIYVQYNDHIYHHQIETAGSTQTAKAAPYLIPMDNKPAKAPTILDLDKEDDLMAAQRDDEDEPIEDDDDNGTEQGHYIGDIKGDLKELFDVNPKPATPLVMASPSPSPVPVPATKTPEKPAEKTRVKKPEVKTPEAKPVGKPEVKTETKPEAKPTTPAKPATPAPVEKPKTTPVKPETKKPEVKKPEVKAPEVKPEAKSEEKPAAAEKPAAKPEEKSGPLTSLGNIGKKIYQVMGSASAGFLKNALSLFDLTKKEAPTGFYISRPNLKTYYGSNEMIYMIQKMGSFTLGRIPDYSVRIGDISKQRGGIIYTRSRGKTVPKHKSHKSGVDADISYYFKEQKDQGQSALTSKGLAREDWLIDMQWGLFKMFNETKLVDRMFIHRKLKKAMCNYVISKGEITADTKEGIAFETLWRLQPRQSDHADHFHLRVKCSSIQQGCLAMPDPPRTTGCF